jgi:capsule polysaccharide export protein KpsE/RkpR
MIAAIQNVSPEEKARSQQRVSELQTEMKKLQEKMQNFASLSKQDQQDLVARIQAISKEMAEAMTPKGVAEAQREMGQKQAEFGCGNISFQLKGSALEGNMLCGEKVGSRGQLKLQGTTKFVGP